MVASERCSVQALETPSDRAHGWWSVMENQPSRDTTLGSQTQNCITAGASE